MNSLGQLVHAKRQVGIDDVSIGFIRNTGGGSVGIESTTQVNEQWGEQRAEFEGSPEADWSITMDGETLSYNGVLSSSVETLTLPEPLHAVSFDEYKLLGPVANKVFVFTYESKWEHDQVFDLTETEGVFEISNPLATFELSEEIPAQMIETVNTSKIGQVWNFTYNAIPYQIKVVDGRFKLYPNIGIIG